MSAFEDLLGSFQEEIEKRKPKKRRKDAGGVPPSPLGGTRQDVPSSVRIDGISSGNKAAQYSTSSGPQTPGTPKVNFLVIGMQKAGTSWIYKMFEEHPGIALSKEKEVHYWDMHFNKDDSWYEDQFAEDVKGKVVGEVTPDYLSMWMEKVGKIHAYNPKMKLIIVYRDEVDRAWSAFLMWCRIENKDVAAMSEDEVFDSLTNEYYQSRGDLGNGLSNFLQRFPKEQVFIAKFADILERPQELMNEVFQFLGVSSLVIENEKLSKNYQITTDRTAVMENTTHSAPDSLKEKLADRLKAFYKPIVKANKAALREFYRKN